ncbi:MAG: ABC transporter ATP-binding protein [Phyllobacteriaceae bacterium]|nr:ABC transporter ATP-binding protein [Phyllobacteriaceae bacterium]
MTERIRLSERLWRAVERIIPPFGDTDREVLPQNPRDFFLYFARQAKGPFMLLVVVGGLAGAVDAALYWSVGWLIDIVESSSPQRLFAEHWRELAGLAFLLLVARTAAMIAATVAEEQIVVPAFYTMTRWQAFRRVMEQPYAFYQNDFAGRISTKIMQGSEAVGDFLVSILQTLWSFATFMVLTTTILMTLDLTMGLVMAAWFVVYLFIGRSLLPEVRSAGRAAADSRSVMTGRMVDAFTNIVAVKLFDGGRREHAYVREGFEDNFEAVLRLTRAITSVRAAVAIVNSLMMTAVGAIAIYQWTAGAISSGAIAVALGLVFRLNQMSGWMMFNINGLIRNWATVQDAIGMISVEPAIRDAADAVEIGRAKGDLAFEGVQFHYGRGGGIIESLNLKLKAGEKVGIVGRSGAGKTTVVNLALRLFDVEGGRIGLDGQDIRTLTQASLRRQFGVVVQDPMLMHRSIRDNIAYGRPGASEDDIVAAAKRAQAHDFIVGLVDQKGRTGYDAHVGERGVKLSGGQRQRVAIARVMLKDAPILILDEATSALDSEVEAAIQDNLYRLMEGKTVIAIAHRLSTIAAMDRLVVMDKGAIVESGTHDELVATGGLYADLWKRQSGGFLVDAALDQAAE